MSDVKYIFFDIDGTLLPFGGELPSDTMEAINLALARGHKLFFCTGRSVGELNDKVKDLPFTGGVFGAGTDVIVDGKSIFESFYSEEDKDFIFSYYKEHDLDPLIQTKNATYMPHSLGSRLDDMFRKYNDGKTLEIGGLVIEDDFSKINDITKTIFFSSDYTKDEIINDIGNRFDIVDNTIGLPKHLVAEVMQKNINKATGIYKVIEYYGASIEDTIAFGDGANDLEMIEAAYIGIAMGNAEQEVKDIAYYVTDDVDKGGIINALRHFCVI